ncbi:MAG: trypsin-like peptidase domain-containing protein [Planctomycetes bacterium]|nr:trypsin-like peptidase domain-containing protein [Planctomycetota bacterium]
MERLTGRYKGEVIETTAAVNGGIDGGPLINSSGRVIGMLIMNYSHSRWLGLAIPINNIPLLPDQRGSKLIPKLNKPLISESLPYGRWIPCIAKVKAVFNERSKFNIPRTSEGIVPLNSGLRRFIPDIDKEIEFYALGPEVSVLAGIGFAKDDSVYIISSYAPVSGNLRSLTVAFMSDRPAEPQIYDAELRGYNEEFDLALLKIKTGITGTRITPLTAAWSLLGTSASLRIGGDPATYGGERSARPDDPVGRVGQDVLIIGANPDIAVNTPAVSRGIISATGRQDGAAFQIDARANHTNMGGPVFNSNGDFLGLCARYTQPLELGTNSGVSLVTAAAKIKEVLPDLLSGKKTARSPTPLLGVQLMPGVIDGGGVRIENVVPNTAVSEAQPITGTNESGLKKGDVIIGFNYRDVLEYRQLVRLIRATRIGDTVILKVKRNNETLEFEVKMRGR